MLTRTMLAGVAFVLTACSPPPRYPTEYQANFRSACASGGGSAGYCDCVWGHIEREIPVEEFIGFDAAARNGQPHPAGAKIQGFTQQCLAQERGN